MTEPILLPANQPADRFYRGGAKIAALRQVPYLGGNVPEDWVGSTTTLFGESDLGLTRLRTADSCAMPLPPIPRPGSARRTWPPSATTRCC